jgi:hypothetical protein
LFKDNADWLDVFAAFGVIAERQLHGAVPETLTAVGAWIALPTIVGLWASSLREVKRPPRSGSKTREAGSVEAIDRAFRPAIGPLRGSSRGAVRVSTPGSG